MVLVSLQNISVSRGGREILHDVSLDIDRNQIITLIGPNGAGKTTLVNVLLGLIKPDSGSVVFNGKVRFGYMPQKLQIDQTLPLTSLRFLQITEPDATQCHEALERIAIQQVAQFPVQSLSGGEMQRLLLARAILRRPDLLVLDEPVQGVDVMGQEELYRLIGDIRRELNCSVLMVSHDLHLVMRTTDQVICLNQHICCHGTPDRVSIDPAFTALFGNRTAPYNHHHDHGHDMHGNVIEEETRGKHG